MAVQKVNVNGVVYDVEDKEGVEANAQKINNIRSGAEAAGIAYKLASGMVYRGYVNEGTTLPSDDNSFYFTNDPGNYIDSEGNAVTVTTEGVSLIQRKGGEWRVYNLWELVSELNNASRTRFASAYAVKKLKDMIDQLAAQGGGSGGGGSVIVDSELSETSLNPVQNAVITAALNELVEAIEEVTAENSVTTDKIADYAVTEKKLSFELGDKINTTKVVADKAAADIGADSITLLQGGINSDGKENTSSYYLRTSRFSTFKLEVNSGYTIGQLAQYDLGGNFVSLYNDYTQMLEGVEWTPTSVVATDKNYYWAAIVFKGNSPTVAIYPREAVVKSFASGLYYYMEGDETDPQSAAQQAKMVVDRTITQLPNEEDLSISDEGKMQFANRSAETKDDKVSSLGYVVIRKNKSFTEQITEPNCIYEIRYEFDLQGGTVTLKEGCTLKFSGGKLSNGTLNCINNTIIDSTLNDILDIELINYTGNVFKADWFVGADEVKISKSFEVFGNVGGSVLLQDRTYNCAASIEVAGKDPAISIYADGRATLLFTNKNDAGLHFNRDWVTSGTIPKFSIRNINIQGQEKIWWNVNDEYTYGDTIGLYINAGQKVTLENLDIHGFKIGFKINGGTDVSATNCYFYNCESGAVISSDTQFFNANYFNNCQFRQNTRNGLLVSQTNFEINTLSLINCKFEANNMYINTNSATEDEQINYATKYKLLGEYGNGLKLSGIIVDQIVLHQAYFEANIHAICIDTNFIDTLYLYNCRLIGNYLTRPCDIWCTDKNQVLSLFANGLNDFYANRPTINKLDRSHKIYQVNSKILAPDPTYVYEFSSATNETRTNKATQRYYSEPSTAIIQSQCITLYQELNNYGFYDILNNESIVLYDGSQIGKIKSVNKGSIVVDITANVSDIPLFTTKGSHFSIDGNSSVKFKDVFNYGESVNYGVIFNYKSGSIMQLVPNTLNIVEQNTNVGSVQRIYIPQSGSCYIYNKTSSPIVLPEGSYHQFGTGVNSIPAGGVAHIYSWANTTYVLSCHTAFSDKSKYTLPTDLGAGFEFPRSSWITMTNDFPSLGIYNHQQKKWLNSMGLTYTKVKGPTDERPALTANDSGVQFFDTTLLKPIWWNGTAWVDSTGTVV